MDKRIFSVLWGRIAILHLQVAQGEVVFAAQGSSRAAAHYMCDAPVEVNGGKAVA
ncbi:hypothetical protein [Mesorhizobium sp. SARCC-RB16n]|uniref:hypothetical protein n=1 Tax=Mesorhizobium sp. SARCC-RB16n TaxID=2116687 RepID=UPI001666A2F1|nr:hypothetical protein [Mesorhizobium sp. SARCC-RB16n]